MSLATETSVEQLAAAAAAGDTEALGALYDRYADPVYRYVLTRFRDAATAEDITSEIWAKVVRIIDQYEYSGGSGFPAWLFSIARSKTIDTWRYHARRPAIPSADMLAYNVATTEGLPEEHAERSDTLDALVKALRKLPRAHAEAVTMRFFLGLSLAETAEATGRTVGTVKVHQHRGLKALAKVLPSDFRNLSGAVSVMAIAQTEKTGGKE